MDEEKSKLIVKLRYRLCEKCTDAIQRWCHPYSGDEESFEDEYSFATSDIEQKNSRRAIWVWLGHQLASSALYCTMCRFLEQVLIEDPSTIYPKAENIQYIVLRSEFVGSYRNEDEYQRCYRPKLQIFEMANSRYIEGPSTFILPIKGSIPWENGNHLNLFHGRILSSGANIALAKDWIDICKTEHVPRTKSFAFGVFNRNNCQPEAKCTIPNFRVIDVQKGCVVQASPHYSYVALSYVWGASKRLVLHSRTWAELTTPGALSQDRCDIPLTFRDALLVANHLGFSYIWIDALCIKQDEQEELESHMNHMDLIYKSAELTLVSNTSSADAGIPGISCAVRRKQVVFQFGNMKFANTTKSFPEAMLASPWESRAWTLQEKIFSKRLLIFTESQIFFQCQCTTWYEDTVLEIQQRPRASDNPEGHTSPDMKPLRRRKYEFGPSPKIYGAHNRFFEQNFWSLVEIYTQRQLTFEKDVIHAFSGILNEISPNRGSLFGVPQVSFSMGLAWVQSSHRMNLRRRDFPSWSWVGWKFTKEVLLRFDNRVWTGFEIHAYFHQLSASGEYVLTAMQKKKRSGSSKSSSNGSIWSSLGCPSGMLSQEAPMEPFVYSPTLMPPLSHIIRFWTSSALLSIESDSSNDVQTTDEYIVRVPDSSFTVGEIYLDEKWKKFNPGPYEFVVISESYSDFPSVENLSVAMSSSNIDDNIEKPALLNVMLIQWVHNVAYRIQMCNYAVDSDMWKKARPQWKVIDMG